MRALAAATTLIFKLSVALTFKVSLVLAPCVIANVARAQDLDEVSFAGTVADENGAVLPGATVTATLISTKSVRSAVTDAEGRYRLVELRPGAYTLRAEAAGFAEDLRAGVQTDAGRSVRLDFELKPAGVSAEQTVVSGRDAPVVDTTRTVTHPFIGEIFAQYAGVCIT